MQSSVPFLNPSDAAQMLGVSAKALRLYEQRGLLAPVRTAAGWRVYGPQQMERAREIIALRGLGLSLTQLSRVLDGDAQGLASALEAHEAVLEVRLSALTQSAARVRALRAELARGKVPTAGELAALLRPSARDGVAFELPWPWGGERFELSEIKALTYIVGPLSSGKTRLAHRLAETLPGATFLGLERLADGGAAARALLDADTSLKARVDEALAWLVEDGAIISDALVATLTGLEADGPEPLIVDMLEQCLDQASQEALIAHLRRRGPSARPLFVLTRSNAILDLAAVGADEAIILCPANHAPPSRIAPYPGAAGYEAVATCLAPPDVRSRTEGVIAWLPQRA